MKQAGSKSAKSETVMDNARVARADRKMIQHKVHKEYCAVFFSNRVINRWNALDQSAVDAPSINAFKQILVKVRNNRMGFFMD